MKGIASDRGANVLTRVLAESSVFEPRSDREERPEGRFIVATSIHANVDHSTVSPQRRSLKRHDSEYPETSGAHPPRSPMTQYAVVFDKTKTGYSTWVPDLPGWVATGSSLEHAQYSSERPLDCTSKASSATASPSPSPPLKGSHRFSSIRARLRTSTAV